MGMVEIRNLSHLYREGTAKIEFPDFTCDTGKAMLIHGPSGSGKSTLLHILSGLLIPTSGSIRIAGRELSSLSERELHDFRRKNISTVFQRHYFIRSLSAWENLQYASFFGRTKTQEDHLKQLLEFLEIYPLRHKKTNELSEGQKQRFSIARALTNQPKLILADEPSAALDDENCERIVRLLIELQEKFDTSLILVSHDSRLMNHFSNSLKLEAI